MTDGLTEIFSHKIRVAGIGQRPATLEINASAPERAALAIIFGLPGIAVLTGAFELAGSRGQDGIIEAELKLKAKLTQVCVVTLEPFESVIVETARLRFVPAGILAEDAESAELNPETLEGPDEIPYAGESIDLGGVLAEQLALALDPYPRKPDAALPEPPRDPAANPFAALGRRTRHPPDSADDPE